MRTRLCLVLVPLALVGAGCSSKSTPSTTATTNPPATTPPTTPPPTTGGSSVTVVLQNFSFSPKTITVTTSQPIQLQNTTPATVHNFSIQGTSVSTDVPAGQTVTQSALGTTLQPGTYMIFCRFHKSLGMTGKIILTSG